jgi:hypothetical protein
MAGHRLAVRTGLWHPSPPAAKTRWARGENDEQAAPVAHQADSGPSLPQPFYAEESGSHRANPSADSAIAHTVLTTPPREGNGFTDSFGPAIRPRHYGEVCAWKVDSANFACPGFSQRFA